MFNGVSEIKFPEGKYGHPLFYLHFVSNLCEYAKTTFHFINITIKDTREQKYFTVHQYSTIKDGIKNSCDIQTSVETMCSLIYAELEVTWLEWISNWSIIMWRVPFSLLGSGYDDTLSVQLTWNKTLSIGWEARAGRYVRGGRKVSDFTCPSEIWCFYPI